MEVWPYIVMGTGVAEISKDPNPFLLLFLQTINIESRGEK